MKQLLTLLLLFCWFFAGATNYTLIGTGNWNEPTIWSPNGVPGSVIGDNVTIPDPGSENSFTVTLTADVVINTLTYNGYYNAASNEIRNVIKGYLTTRKLTISNTSTWVGGFLDDIELIIPDGVILTLATGTKALRNNAKVTNEGGGTCNWTGGALYFYDAAQIVNKPNATFTNNTTANLLYSTTNSTTVAFKNEGTFNNNSSNFQMTIHFENNNIMNINSGPMKALTKFTNTGIIYLKASGSVHHMENYSSTSPGKFHFEQNCTLEFDDDSTVGIVTVDPGVNGTIAFVDEPTPTGSNVTIDEIIPSGIALDFSAAKTVTLNVIQSLNNSTSFSLSNTVLNGSGKLTIESGNTLTWNDGTIDGDVTLEVAAGANLLLTTGSAKKIKGNAQLTVASNGIANLSNGTLELTGPSATMVNNGTFNLNGDYNIAYGGSLPSITNNNVIKKTSGAGTSRIEPDITNSSSGIISVESGTIDFYRTLTNSGTLKGIGTMSFYALQPALGGTIAPGLSPGTLTFSGNRTISGSLNIEVDGSSVDKLVVTGNVTLTGASLAITEISPLTQGSWFTILRSQGGTISGTFSGTLPSGYSIDYTSTEVRILNGILPVELTQFTALITAAANRLHWETASETNAAWHIVERSSTGSTWEEIGRLAAAGTSLETHTYDFEDLSPLPLSYYRLRTVDLDGSFEFSKTIVLQRSGGRLISLNTYPNPADSKLNVDIYSPEEQDATLLVADQFGRILHTEEIHAEEGLNSNELIVSDLPAGIYFIEVKTERSLSMQKFVKQ